jgi:hypothetical protein
MYKNLLKTVMFVLALSGVAWAAGAWSTNKFSYKPQLTTQGTTDYTNFNTSQDRVDTRLAREVWVGDTNVSGYSTFAAAVATLNASGVATTLYVPAGTHTVSADLTVNSNIALRPSSGAFITVATTKTLTINGQLDAGRYKIFVLTGTGAVAGLKTVFPEWFGAIGNGTTDDSTALTASVAACAEGGVILLAKGVYKTTGLLVSKTLSMISDCPMSYGTVTGSVLKAAGNQAYVLKMQGTMVNPAETFVHSQLRGITISGDNKTISDAAFVLEYSHLAKITNCLFTDVAGTGVRFRTAWELQFHDNFILDCGALDTGRAVYFDGPSPLDYAYGSSNVSMRNNVWSSNKGRWLQLSSLANMDGFWFEGNKLELDDLTILNTVDTNILHLGSLSRAHISDNTFGNFGTSYGRYTNMIWIGGVNDDGLAGSAGNSGNIIRGNRYYGGATAGAINGLYLAANAPTTIEQDNTLASNAAAFIDALNVNVSTYQQLINRAWRGYSTSLFPGYLPSRELPGFYSVHKMSRGTYAIPFEADANVVNDAQTALKSTAVDAVIPKICASFDLRQFLGTSATNFVVRIRARVDAGASTNTVCVNPVNADFRPIYHCVNSTTWTWYEFIHEMVDFTTANHYMDVFHTSKNGGTANLLVDGFEFGVANYLVTTASTTPGTITLPVTGILPRVVNIDSTLGVIDMDLPNGTYPGQRQTVRLTNAANVPCTLDVANHVTSNPERFNFDLLGATVEFLWDGSNWSTIYNHGATTP